MIIHRKLTFASMFLQQIPRICLILLCALGISLASYAQQNPLDLQHRVQGSKQIETEEPTAASTDDTLDISESDSADEADMERDSGQSLGRVENPLNKAEEEKGVEEKLENEINILDKTSLPRKKILIFAILILLITILTVVVSANRNLSSRIVKAFMNDNFLNLLLREQRNSIKPEYLFLYLFFIVNTGLFLFLWFDEKSYEALSKYTLFHYILFVFCAYAVRHLTVYLIGNLFEIKKELGQYNFTILIFNLMLSFFLFPINLFIAFSPESVAEIAMYCGLAAIVIFYLFRAARGIFIAFPFYKGHKFHFILYLCIVEIAPILLFIELANRVVS